MSLLIFVRLSHIHGSWLANCLSTLAVTLLRLHLPRLVFDHISLNASASTINYVRSNRQQMPLISQSIRVFGIISLFWVDFKWGFMWFKDSLNTCLAKICVPIFSANIGSRYQLVPLQGLTNFENYYWSRINCQFYRNKNLDVWFDVQL